MKKFSNISGFKVTQEPQIEKQVEETEVIKYSILELMNQLLRIESYGSARKNILPTVKITGQEMFVEALFDMLSDKSFKDQIKALENLKSKNRDWETIDESINLINQKITKSKELKSNSKHIKKIKDLIDIYGEDEDNFRFVVEKYCGKIKSADVAYQRSIAAKMMIESDKFKDYSKEKLTLISELFLNKANDLKQ